MTEAGSRNWQMGDMKGREVGPGVVTWCGNLRQQTTEDGGKGRFKVILGEGGKGKRLGGG